MNNHKHNGCRHLLEALSDYINGELGEMLCSEIEQHLEECENCQVVVDTLKKTVYLYRTTADTPAMPTDVRERLFRRLDLEEFLEK